MTTQAVRARARWIAPVAVLSAALAVPALVQTSAQADPTLPDITAQKLVEQVIASKPVALQGEVSQTMKLGLPELPGQAQSSSIDPMSLATGTHTWRVWYDGVQSSRVALVDGRSESAIISNPTDTWLWNSQTREAVHSKTPSKKGDNTSPEMNVTPAEAAKKLLAAADETTTVDVAGTTTVAGRSAYDLTLTPAQGRTLVKQVSIAIDAITKQPLRVQVWSTRLSEPAVNIGYTRISFTQPSADTFTFSPPPGATVVEAAEAERRKADQTKRKQNQKTGQPAQPSGEKPTVTGKGWGSVVVAKNLGDLTGGPAELTGLLEALPKVSGSWGSGRVLNGTLFTVVVTDDGRAAAGAVPAEALYRALG